jgi:hypothetical protein
LVEKKSYLDNIRSNRFLLILIPLVLTSFTHFWNPVGFPDFLYDEGVYLRRAMHVLDGLGPQESPYLYDHPFFGQLFLAGMFKLLNFPQSVTSSELSDIGSIDTLFLVPRLIMGGLAVLDTLLIYKIAEKKYGTNVALVSAILFSVMPMTWIFRRILLDSILVPFLLSSILFALNSSIHNSRKYTWALLSGICFGIAIFTKVPTLAIIPLFIYLLAIPRNKNTTKHVSYNLLLLWLVPVILIPAIWPLESISSGNFEHWVNSLMWQAERLDRLTGLPQMIGVFIIADPLLFTLSAIGGIYAIAKKNWLILLWVVPFIIFLAAIGQPSYFHWAAIIPVFCIGAAIALVDGLPRLLERIKVHNKKIFFVTIALVCFLGLVFTTIVISTDVSLAQRQTISYTISHLERNNFNGRVDDDILIISSPSYSWIFKYVYRANNTLSDFRDAIYYPIETQDWLLIVDPHYREDMGLEPKLQTLYDEKRVVTTFNSYPLLGVDRVSYPYTNLIMTAEGCEIEINTRRTDRDDANSNDDDVISGATNTPRCYLVVERWLNDLGWK